MVLALPADPGVPVIPRHHFVRVCLTDPGVLVVLVVPMVRVNLVILVLQLLQILLVVLEPNCVTFIQIYLKMDVFKLLYSNRVACMFHLEWSIEHTSLSSNDVANKN